MARVRIRGVANTKRELAKELAKVRKGVRKGLIKAGAVIKAHAVNNAPIDTGNLRASHYLYWRGATVQVPNFRGDDSADLREAMSAELSAAQAQVVDFMVRVGSGAHYALWVHEGNPAYNWNSGGPKFLQRAMESNKSRILTMVANEAKIKG
jgi:hypothetical protein